MGITYRPFIINDEIELVDLFMRVRPTIFRLQERKVYQALIHEILKSNGTAFGIVAVEDNKFVGFITAAIDWPRFKVSFVMKYPKVGLLLLRKRIRNILKLDHKAVQENRDKDFPKSVNPFPNKVEEGGSKKGIAYIIQSGVDPAHRSKGIGTGVHAAIQKFLATQGIKRIECHIDEGNIASVVMHERTNWTMFKNETGYFGYVYISEEK